MYYRVTAPFVCLILIAACALALGAPIQATPPKPIPTGAKCYTQAEFDTALDKFYHRTVIEAYRSVGMRDPKWDEKAVAFLEGYIKHEMNSEEQPSTDDWYAMGKELMDLGCTDPLVLYAYGIACRPKRDYDGMISSVRKSFAAFENSKYLKVHARKAALGILEIEQAWKQRRPEDAGAGDLFRRWNMEMLADGSFLPGEERIALMLLCEQLGGLPYPGKLDLYEALKKQPGVDPYVLNAIGGRCYLQEGWRLRGHGFASEVTDEGWKGFETNCEASYKLFAAAWKLRPECPEAPVGLVELAMAGHVSPKESERLWFDRAVAAQMDYDPAYRAYMMALLPRWGGSHKQIYDFGVECLMTGRFDTTVPLLFPAALAWIASDIDPDPTYAHKPETAVYFKQMWDGYAKTGKLGSPDHCETMKALSLWQSGHYEDAKAVMDALADRVDKTKAFELFNTKYETVHEELDVLGVEPGKGLGEVQALYDEGRLPQALARCEQVLSKSAESVEATRYARNWLVRLVTEVGLTRDDWVDVTPEADLAGWCTDAGEWTRGADASVLGVSEKIAVAPALRSMASVGSQFELKGEFEIVSPQGFGVTALVGINGTWRRIEVFFAPDKAEVGVSWKHANFIYSEGRPVYQQKNAFVITYWNGKVLLEVNGKQMGGVFTCNSDAGKEKSLPPDPRVCLTISARSTKAASSIKFSNLGVRRLTEMPKAIAEKAASR